MAPVMSTLNGTPGQPTVRRLLAGALAGLLTAAVALGVAELAAAITGPRGRSGHRGRGDRDQPDAHPGQGFRDRALRVARQGSPASPASWSCWSAFAALIGMLAVRRIGYGLAGLAVFAVVGVAAAVHLPNATAVDVVPTLAGVAVAAAALVILVRAVWAAFPVAEARHGVASFEGSGPPADLLTGGPYLGDLAGAQIGPETEAARRPDRRRFLICGGGSGGAGRGGGRSGRQAARTVQRRLVPGAGAAARPGRRRQGRPGGRRPPDPRADALLHLQQQLLPGRHRPGPAAGVAGKLDAADRRHGRPGTRVHLRRTAEDAADRERHDAGVRIELGRRPLPGQRQVARRAAGRAAAAGRGAGGRGSGPVRRDRRDDHLHPGRHDHGHARARCSPWA